MPDWRRFFRPIEAANRTHSECYVEDFPPKCGQKRYVKMAWLNLLVLPLHRHIQWNRC
nr:secretion protein HlyD [Selenomonas sp. oral taxon 126]